MIKTLRKTSGNISCSCSNIIEITFADAMETPSLDKQLKSIITTVPNCSPVNCSCCLKNKILDF